MSDNNTPSSRFSTEMIKEHIAAMFDDRNDGSTDPAVSDSGVGPA